MPAGALMPHLRIQLHPHFSRISHKKYHGVRLFHYENYEMTIASDLLQQHIQTLVDDNARWQTLIADDILWELSPMRLRLAIRRNWQGGRKRSVTQPGSSVLWRTSASSTSISMS